jgi:hypothetical protein
MNPKMHRLPLLSELRKISSTIESLKKANIDIQEQVEGIYIKDIDNTTICLKK